MAGWFRRPRDAGGVTSGFLGDLIEVFQPSRRHVEAERERRDHHAQLPESGAPPVSVDLDAGVAYLRPTTGAPDRDPAHHEPTDDAASRRRHLGGEHGLRGRRTGDLRRVQLQVSAGPHLADRLGTAERGLVVAEALIR